MREDDDWVEETSLDKIGWYIHEFCGKSVFVADTKLGRERYCGHCRTYSSEWTWEPGYDFRNEAFHSTAGAKLDQVLRHTTLGPREAVATTKMVLAEVMPILRTGAALEAFQFLMEHDRGLAIAYYEHMTRKHPEDVPK